MKTLILTFLLVALSAFGQHQKPTFSDKAVAAVLVAEAGGEKSEKSLWAVAEVIHNRSVARHWSYLFTIERPYQFSCLNGITMAQLVYRTQSHPRFEVALHISEVMRHTPGRLPRFTRGAMHYTTTTCNAYWVFEKPLVVIGHHEFFR